MSYDKTYADLHKQKEELIKYGKLEKAIIIANTIAITYFCGHVMYWFLSN